MTPVKFPESNVVYGANQKEYLPLPALRDPNGVVATCWRLSRWERLKLLVTGRLWLLQLTFGDPLQLQCPTVDRPIVADPVPGTAPQAAQ